MTVNKLQLPAKENAVQLKINEIIDNLGGGGATDVQINGTSITSDGVANILTNSAYSSSNKIATMSDVPSTSGLANTDLSNLSATGETHFLKSIDSTDVIYALGYTPQKSSTAVTHSANAQVGDSSTPVYIASNGTATSTGLSIASSRFDGQWVSKYLEVTTATSTGSRTHDLSSYLPSASATYEIWGRIGIAYGSGTSVYAVGTASSPYTNRNSAIYVVYAGVTSNSRSSYINFIMPVSNKTIYSQVATAALGTAYIELHGYRRIGTNS